MSEESKKKVPLPSKAWYLMAPLVLVVFGVGGLVWMVWTLKSSATAGHQFKAPGEVLFSADASGTYLLWYHTRTVFDGHEVKKDDEELFKKIEFSIVDQQSGAVLEARERRGETRASGSDISFSLYSFKAPRAGSYRVNVTGDFEPRSFSIGPSFFPGALWVVILGGTSAAFGWVGGPFIAFMLFIKRHQLEKQRPDLAHS